VWLSLAFGIAVSALIALLAAPLVSLMGGEGDAADYAVTYLRIAAIGFPAAFLALGAQGYLRGVADLRTPLVILIAGNVANVFLELLFVYGFDWGIAGSAWGTAIAQLGMGAAFVVVVLRRLEPGEARVRLALARRVLSLGKWIFIRTSALMLSFVLAGAVATRFGDASIAAHQVAFQLWIFLALVLDAVAIAGQIIVGRELGAGRREAAYGASSRMIWLSVALGAVFTALMLLLAGVLPRAFTGDASVLAEAALLWPIFALMQPLNGAVFALDGILIGASDGPFLAFSMLAAFLVCATMLLVTLEADWGIRGVWAALLVLIVVRLGLMTTRFRRGRWLVTGWAS
jgi:putative MATE family efflux protein